MEPIANFLGELRSLAHRADDSGGHSKAKSLWVSNGDDTISLRGSGFRSQRQELHRLGRLLQLENRDIALLVKGTVPIDLALAPISKLDEGRLSAPNDMIIGHYVALGVHHKPSSQINDFAGRVGGRDLDHALSRPINDLVERRLSGLVCTNRTPCESDD